MSLFSSLLTVNSYQPFCPLFQHSPHANNGKFMSLAIFTTEHALCSLVFQIVSVKTPLTIAHMLLHFNFNATLLEPYLLLHNSVSHFHNRLIAVVCRPSNISRKEKKVSVKFIANPIHSSSKMFLCCMCTCHCRHCILFSLQLNVQIECKIQFSSLLLSVSKRDIFF